MLKDPLLEKIVSADSDVESDYYSTGLQYIKITNSDIKSLNLFFQDLYLITGNKQNPISNNAGDHLQGAIFALGTVAGNKNREWRGHTASSLREMIHPWKNDGIYKYFKKLNNPYVCDLSEEQKKEIKKACETILVFYRYFSGVTHHNLDGITQQYRILEGAFEQSYEDCIKKDVFIKMINKFFTKLKYLMSSCKPELISKYEST